MITCKHIILGYKKIAEQTSTANRFGMEKTKVFVKKLF